MPIKGITDKGAAAKEIGRLRLGISKAEQQSERKGPRELPYFRADFRPEEQEAYAAFVAAYGNQPTRINIRLPFADITRVLDSNYECYDTTGLIAMADGERFVYLRAKSGLPGIPQGSLIVRNGEVLLDHPAVKVDEAGKKYLPFDPAMPIYSYKNGKGQDVAVFAKAKTRLSFVIPELMRSAVVTVVSNSVYNAINLNAEIQGILEQAQIAGLRLPLVPLILTRRLDKISVSIGGQKSMQEKYLIHVEIDPAWMAGQFAMLSGIVPGAALPAPRQVVALELPAGTPAHILDGEEGEDEEEITDEPAEAQLEEQEPEPAQAHEIPASRPPISLAEALEVRNADGIPYGKINPQQRDYMLASLRNLKERNAEQERKLQALLVIKANEI